MRTRAVRLLACVPGAIVALGVIALAAMLVLETPGLRSAAAPPGVPLLNPAAWGNDHVGQPLPEFMESGECLFCHRDQVGGSWQTNKHNRTIRDAEAPEPAMQALRADPKTKVLADQVQLIVGDTRAQKFLKRSANYGKLDLLSVGAAFGRGRRAKIDSADKPHWDAEAFALECAGCHTTAVDPKTHAFATVSVDCYSCHGDGMAEHPNDPKLIPLAKARKDSPAAITSICGSCHVRFGKSNASGLPYPTNFVAGDNLFKDFQVDFAQADNARLNPSDRHVMENVRDVVVHGRQTMTCLSCHDVHNGSSKRHRELASEQYCNNCHDAARPIKGSKIYEVHSEQCRY